MSMTLMEILVGSRRGKVQEVVPCPASAIYKNEMEWIEVTSHNDIEGTVLTVVDRS